MAPWRWAKVVAIQDEAPDAKTFRLSVPGGMGHRPGQHAVVRLTAPDGYTTQRSYSIASAPDANEEFDLTVERLDGGEVSPYLHDVLAPGEELEVRGPLGGWFVWEGDSPALLIGGGSGVVPLMAMIRYARQHGTEQLLNTVVSVRSPDDLYYRNELIDPRVTVVYTRRTPAGFHRAPGRVTTEDLAPALSPGAIAYVCGSNGFADAVTSMLQSLGVVASSIRVERFGTG